MGEFGGQNMRGVVDKQTGIIARGVKGRMCDKFKELHKQLVGLGEPPAYIEFWYQHFLVEGKINKAVTGGTLVTRGVVEVICWSFGGW